MKLGVFGFLQVTRNMSCRLSYHDLFKAVLNTFNAKGKKTKKPTATSIMTRDCGHHAEIVRNTHRTAASAARNRLVITRDLDEAFAM